MGFINNYFNREYGIIKTDDARTIETVKIQNNESMFIYQGKRYNVLRQGIYRDFTKGLFVKKYKYFYNVNNSNPLTFNKTTRAFEPVISPLLYHNMMENEILIKLNTVQKNWLKNLSPQHIIIGLIVVGAVIYLLTGNKIT